MEDFFKIISNYGFPVSVASYLLFKFEKKLETLAKINDQLVVEVKTLEKKITYMNKQLNKKL